MPLNHNSKYSELTDQQFILIGKIVIEFSNIEFLLGLLLTRILLTPSFIGRTYTDNLNISSVIKAIRNGLEVHAFRYMNRFITKQTAEEIITLLSKVHKIQEIRNRFAHQCFARHTDDAIYGSKLSGDVPKENSLKPDTSIITNSQLLELYSEAFKLVDILRSVIRRFKEVEELKVIEDLLTDSDSSII